MAAKKKFNKTEMLMNTLCIYGVIHTLFSGGFSIAGFINLFNSIVGLFS